MLKIKLSEIMGRKRIRPVDLAKMTGLSKTTIHKLYYEKSANLGVETLNKLCKTLDCKISDLLEYVPD